MRYVTGVVILIAASMACSRGADRPVATLPTGPSAAVTSETTISFVGGVSGPMDVLFPGRNDSFQFRNDLEAKYQNGLNRSATTTYVDREGEVVWTQEYIRYRVNGCDHSTAVSRVMAQIDGGVAGGICSAPAEGLILFPSRADALQFRRELETKYQQMGRALAPTFVDLEGAVIWIQEYLRYRINACDHATATSKVVSQIDGGAVPATCFVPCTYALNPGGLNSGPGGSSQSLEIRPNAGGCAWTATSTASWLTIASGSTAGSGFTVLPYTIAQNTGGERTGYIDVVWSGGGIRYIVNQAASSFTASFTMTDSFRSGSAATTECHVRSAATPCVLTATSNLPGGGSYTYAWTVTYFYGTQKTVLQSGTSNTLTVTDGCGGTGSHATGNGADFNVTVTITDSLGNTVTLRSGDGNQPALALRLFTC